MKISQSIMKDFKGYYSAKHNPHKIQQGNYCGLLF